MDRPGMQNRHMELELKESTKSADEDGIQQELQDAHATGGGKSNIWFYN
jgi:hypothetical protein